MAMTLAGIRRGKIADHAIRVMLYGPEGIGKSTFAQGAPSPVFLCPEDGTAQLDVARLPEPQVWGDVMKAIELLRVERHEFKTFVVDTLDWLEPLVWASVCAAASKATIEDFGFGKGYTAALYEWREFVKALDRLRAERKMGVILLAHSVVKSYKNPEGEDYDRYTLKLNDKAGGLLKEWTDAVLFANYETFVQQKSKDRPRAKAFGGVERKMYSERRAAWDAKNRFGLPDELQLGWAPLVEAIAAGASTPSAEPGNTDPLVAELVSVVSGIGDPERLRTMHEWLAKKPNAAAIATAIKRNREIASDKKEVA